MMTKFKELYDDMLDGIHECGTYKFSALLLRAYPSDYQIGFNDWLNDDSTFVFCENCERQLEQ